MLSLSGPKALVLLQLLIPVITCSAVNVPADTNDLQTLAGSHGKRYVC